MIVYIRHGHDEYDDATHRHDHKLTDKGASKSVRLARKLIKKYGKPDIIYVSPFQRTIGTAQAMCETKRIGKPQIVVDTDLSRVFSGKEQKDPSVATCTQDYKVPIKESRRQREKRIRHHVRKMKHEDHLNSGQVVWVITHTLIMKGVAEKLKVKVPDHFEFLTWFSIKKAK